MADTGRSISAFKVLAVTTVRQIWMMKFLLALQGSGSCAYIAQVPIADMHSCGIASLAKHPPTVRLLISRQQEGNC